MQTGTQTLWADFNGIDDDDDVWMSLDLMSAERRLAAAFLRPGEVVDLYDGEGNSCVGHVVSVDAAAIVARIDWDTFRSTSVEVHYEYAYRPATHMVLVGTGSPVHSLGGRLPWHLI